MTNVGHTHATEAHHRLMAELVATMAANTRTPLYDIKVTVGAADLDSELGTMRELLETLEAVDEMFSAPGRINKNTVRDRVRFVIAKARGGKSL
jgi:hypothetical protein